MTHFNIDDLSGKYKKEEGNKNIEVSKKAWKTIKKLGLKQLFRKPDVMICGGSILSMFSNNTPSNIDIYFANESAFIRFYKEIDEVPGSYIIEENETSVTFKIKTKTIQLIKNIFGTPIEILELFDFTICQVCYVPKTDSFYMHKNFHEHLHNKVLTINPNMPYPISSLVRVGKYLNSGFILHNDQAMLLGVLINNLKLDNYSSLKENVSGIYSYSTPELFPVENKLESPIDIDEIIQFVDN